MWCVGGHNRLIGSSAVTDVLAVCPKATATVLLDDPMMASLSLGLLK